MTTANETICGDPDYALCADMLHHSSAHKDVLTPVQHLVAMSICDGYGKLSMAQLQADGLTWDFSHVRDSSEEALKACAHYIRIQQAIVTAAELGKAAFAAGKVCTPVLDKAYMDLLTPLHCQVGESIPVVEAWLKAWHTANLEQRVETLPAKTDMTVANEIHRQFRRAFVMLGAKDFVGDNDSLTFTIRGCRKINKIKIQLEATDTYRLVFFKLNTGSMRIKPRCEVIEDKAGLYDDMVTATIESVTGLRTSL